MKVTPLFTMPPAVGVWLYELPTTPGVYESARFPLDEEFDPYTYDGTVWKEGTPQIKGKWWKDAYKVPTHEMEDMLPVRLISS